VATAVAEPISKAATSIAEPIYQKASDVATSIAEPVSKAVTSVAEPIYQKVSDVATSIAEPVSKAVTSVAEPIGKAISTAADTVKDALPSGGVKISGDNLDKSIIDLMGQAPAKISDTVAETPYTTPTTGGPAVSDVASGASASPAAFSGADVAMLGDTSEAGLGSKVSKKGGKYPFGEPEGTSALKEGLGIG
jgi:phage-related protein